MRELLNAVKEKKLHTAVASGSDTSVIKEYLEKTGLTEYFDMVLSSKDVKRGKPYPDVFLEICQKFDVKPEETLVLEDSSNGVQAALAGNLPVINVPDLLPIPEEQQEKCVAVVSDLVQVIPLLDLKNRNRTSPIFLHMINKTGWKAGSVFMDDMNKDDMSKKEDFNFEWLPGFQ